MKKAIFRIFNVFLAVIVLLSSSGFGLVEHSCTMRGKQTSFHKKGDLCCGIKTNKQVPLNKQQATLKKTQCCSDDEKYENVEYSSSVSQLVAKFTQNTIDWLKSTVSAIVKSLIETILEKHSSYLSSTPSSSSTGRSIVISTQSFLI